VRRADNLRHPPGRSFAEVPYTRYYVIEEALGSEAAAVLPEAIRLVELRARIPRYQRDMLHFLAQRNQTTVDEVLARELEDVACAHAEELSSGVAGFEAALVWPEAVLGGGASQLAHYPGGNPSLLATSSRTRTTMFLILAI